MRLARWGASRAVEAAEHIRVFVAIPPKVRALIIQGAAAILLVCLGVVIKQSLAWVLIGVTVTAIVLLFLATLFERDKQKSQSDDAQQPTGSDAETPDPMVIKRHQLEAERVLPWQPPPAAPRAPGDALVKAQITAQKAKEARRAELEQGIKRGKYLARRCRQAQIQLSLGPIPFVAENTVAELTAIVEDWKGETGGYVVPEPKGNWRVDLARLTLYVEKHVAALEGRLNKADEPAA